MEPGTCAVAPWPSGNSPGLISNLAKSITAEPDNFVVLCPRLSRVENKNRDSASCVLFPPKKKLGKVVKHRKKLLKIEKTQIFRKEKHKETLSDTKNKTIETNNRNQVGKTANDGKSQTH